MQDTTPQPKSPRGMIPLMLISWIGGLFCLFLAFLAEGGTALVLWVVGGAVLIVAIATTTVLIRRRSRTRRA